MMHIMSGVWQAHILQLMKGGRPIAVPRKTKEQTKESYGKVLNTHDKVVKQQAAWEVTEDVQVAKGNHVFHHAIF